MTRKKEGNIEQEETISEVSQSEDSAQRQDDTPKHNTREAAQPVGVKKERGTPPPDITYATPKQKIILALLLFITTVTLLIIWFYVLNDVEKKLQSETTVSWNAPSDLLLSPGPPSFWYDKKSQMLHHRGPIDRELKEELISLLEVAKDADVQLQAANRDYSEAIERLAYQSNEVTQVFIIYILLLGGLSGALGAQLRSIGNFVGVSSYKNRLDVSRWWPWYVMRPIEGFLIGVISVFIVKAGLFLVERASSVETSWWIGITLLTGFGASDFTYRLRLLSKTLFGESP